MPTADRDALLYSNQNCDDLRQVFLQAIQEAKESIVITSFTINDTKIITALNLRAAEGLQITVMYDPSLSSVQGLLAKEILLIEKSPKQGLMHKKILITDESKVWIGSSNLTTSSLRMHGNLITAFEHPAIAKSLLLPLHESSESPPQHFSLHGQDLELWQVPENPQAKERLLKLINGANHSLKIAMFTWTEQEIAEAVIAAHRRGVHVNVIIDRYSGNGASSKVVLKLLSAHIPVRISQGLELFHYKFLWVDDRTLINGSLNWTVNAFAHNHECFVILSPLTQEQASFMHSLWNHLYAASVS